MRLHTGLWYQAKKSNRVVYETLSPKILEDYLEELEKKQEESNRRYITPVSEYMSRVLTATHNNDTVELEKLREEAYLARIKELKGISKRTGTDYDLIYLIDKTFNSRLPYGYSYCWEISINNLGKDEYDDSYEVEALTWGKNSGWIHSKKWSDGFYDNKTIFSNKVKNEDLFNFLIK